MDVSSPAIEAFVNELIQAKFAGQQLDEAVASDIRRELTEKLHQYLTLRTIEMVSESNPDALRQLSELIKTNPQPEEVQKFIAQYVKEPDALVGQIFTDFRTLYLGVEPTKTN